MKIVVRNKLPIKEINPLVTEKYYRYRNVFFSHQTGQKKKSRKRIEQLYLQLYTYQCYHVIDVSNNKSQDQ